jgi:GNAT superfamily N-acetyltransferase
MHDRRRAADVWWVQSVYVLPEHRHQGHFKAMYQHVRQEAERQGAAGVRLYADNGNTKAHAAVGACVLPHAEWQAQCT